MIVRSCDIHVMRGRLQRLRGLIATKPQSAVFAFPQCSDVHTFCMSYALDLAFLDTKGLVLASYRAVQPGCRLRYPFAWCVLERAAAPSPWFESGMRINEDQLAVLQGKEF